MTSTASPRLRVAGIVAAATGASLLSAHLAFEQPVDLPVSISLAAPPDWVLLEGFGQGEDWGRWSAGERAAVRLLRPIAGRVQVTLVGRAYGPNAGAPTRVRCGVGGGDVTFDASLAEAAVVCQWSGAPRRLEIDVPRPVSPSEWEGGTDTRRLGVGLAELRLAPAP